MCDKQNFKYVVCLASQPHPLGETAPDPFISLFLAGMQSLTENVVQLVLDVANLAVNQPALKNPHPTLLQVTTLKQDFLKLKTDAGIFPPTLNHPKTLTFCFLLIQGPYILPPAHLRLSHLFQPTIPSISLS